MLLEWAMRIVSLPGVPYEMKALVSNELLPLLREEIDYQILHKTLFVVGVPESVLADKIEPFEDDFQGLLNWRICRVQEWCDCV